MPLKVAVASNDGKIINQHFGKSRQFYIYDIIDNGEFTFLELRENTPSCSGGDHEDDAMQRTVNLLSDCNVVLVSRIGYGAEHRLKRNGIRSYAVYDFIESALAKLVESERTQTDLSTQYQSY